MLTNVSLGSKAGRDFALAVQCPRCPPAAAGGEGSTGTYQGPQPFRVQGQVRTTTV